MVLVHKCGHNKNGFQVNKPDLLKIYKVRATKTYVFKKAEAEKLYRLKFCLFQGEDLKQEKGNF